MVKEVEFANILEVLAETQDYSNSGDQPLFTGKLSDDGVTLDISVHVPLLPELLAKRKLYLYFGNVDFENKLTDYVSLGESDFDYCQGIDGFTDIAYNFDLNKVLIIPRKVYNTGGTSEITVELYTYEANLGTDYGAKTLSVPYTMHSDTKYKYDKSTDGVYKLVMIDFEPWVATRTYGVGDVVYVDDGLLVSTIENNSDLTTVGTWETATEDDILGYSYGGSVHPPLRSIISYMMISRYAKHNIIKESLLSVGFKSYDDSDAYEMTLLLQNLRERAKFKLLAHKPIDALYSLQMLKLASSKTTDTTKVHNYNIKYTL